MAPSSIFFELKPEITSSYSMDDTQASSTPSNRGLTTFSAWFASSLPLM